MGANGDGDACSSGRKKGEKVQEITYVGLDVVTPKTARSSLPSEVGLASGTGYAVPALSCRRWASSWLGGPASCYQDIMCHPDRPSICPPMCSARLGERRVP